MRRRNMLIVIIAVILFMVSIPSGAVMAEQGIVLNSEVRERLIEQYGLSEPEPPNTASWHHIDIGVSYPIFIIVSIGRLFSYPYAFVAEILSWLYLK